MQEKWNAGNLVRKDAGKDGCRKRGMQKRRDAEKEGCSIGGIPDCKDLGPGGYIKGEIQN